MPKLSAARLAKKFDKDVAVVTTELRRFRSDPTPGATHGARRGIRKLEAARLALPKRVRKQRPVKSYWRRLKNVLDATNAARDCDIILHGVPPGNAATDYRRLVASARSRRQSSIHRAMKSIDALTRLRPPRVRSSDMTDSKVRNRFRKLSKSLARKVDDEMDEWLASKDVETMHALRRDARRLRYVLEVSMNKAERRSDATVDQAKTIHDSLGAIRDADLLIDALRKGAASGGDGVAILRDRVARRQALVEEFIAKQRGKPKLHTTLVSNENQ